MDPWIAAQVLEELPARLVLVLRAPSKDFDEN